MVRNNLYDQLINSDPLGFIDPLTDLGEFDAVQMKFKAPVHQLKNKYSGQPYSKKWQSKIEEMRKLYIQYQLSLQEKDKKEEYYKREKTTDSKEYSNEIVTTYLKLGFGFRDIEKQVSISYRTQRCLFVACVQSQNGYTLDQLVRSVRNTVSSFEK
jgi:hypothetical protein